MKSESLRGSFLIAVKRLKDENFFRTVVLLLEHSDGGAMGVVINRPLELTVSEALAKHFPVSETSDVVYCGGPVEANALLILHNSTEHDQEYPEIVPGVFVGTSADIFDRVVAHSREPDPTFRYRLFAGYAGWGAEQLEGEIARGDWFVLPASPTYIFCEDPYEIWDELLRDFHAAHRIIPGSQEDPELN